VKTSGLIIALFACALKAQAQGTIQFYATLTGADEVPPNSDPTIARGTFTLDGNILNFLVDVPIVTFSSLSGFIQGPALPGSTAPVIFDLGAPVPHSGSQGDPPFYRFASPQTGPFGAGPFTLTADQITQLQGSLWYVNITSAMQPEGQLRGQIFQVPEPNTVALIGSGATIWLLRKRRRPK